VVTYHLEAGVVAWPFAKGRSTMGWGYNGQVPGPVLEARVGDVIEVRLTNSLPEPTLIHWHGLRVPPVMDGTDDVQRPVAPGETFTYRFLARDAGTFWYHPHVNETVQLERGLYGALIVRGESEPVLDGERILVLDDLSLDEAGGIVFGGGARERHDGREGAVRLVNGRAEAELVMAAGQVERWRILNCCSARYIRLSIGGGEFLILGTDGGLIEAPVRASEVLLAPADRVELAVGPFREGEVIGIDALPYDRGLGPAAAPERFAQVRVGAAELSSAVLPERLRRIEPLVDAASVSPTRRIRLSGRMGLRADADFLINDETHHVADPVRVDELQVWDVINESALDHPFHLHGFFFQVLEVNDAPPPFRSWEDTVNVPAHGSVRIAWLPDDRPGPWMYHCHILEHHAAGMMAHFQVLRPGEEPLSHSAHVHAHAHEHNSGEKAGL
jgi:FtsP/CotA-like multicopper oxidase with cupredoxin domain